MSVLVVALVLTAGCSAAGATSVPAPGSPAPTPGSAAAIPSPASPTPASPRPASPRPEPTPTLTSPAPLLAGTGTLRVLGLGDSVTTGYHCDCMDYVTAFGSLLAQQQGRRVSVDHEGSNGARTSDVATQLDNDTAVRREAGDASVVVITIGANDLGPDLDRWRSRDCPASCYAPDVAAMARRLGALLAHLDRLRPDAAPGTVLVTTYWNVFADGEVGAREETDGYLDWSDAITRAANTAICRTARTAGARCVDLYAPFKGHGEHDPTHLLADDGDHPNPAGTTLISRAVLAALPARR